MQPIANLIQLPRASPTKATGKAARRKLVISELEQLTGIKDVWRYLIAPVYIQTDWLEEWKQGIILKRGGRKEKAEYLMELIKGTRK